MRVAFRLECNEKVGSGHLARCLTLAEEIVRRGGEAQFLVTAESNTDWIARKKYSYDRFDSEKSFLNLLAPMDWLIFDSYNVGYEIESNIPGDGAEKVNCFLFVKIAANFQLIIGHRDHE